MDNRLPTSSPEAQGIASGAIIAFLDAAEETIDALHSVVLLRHGHVVAKGWWAPYASDVPHMLFSLSKSFTSTGIGLAVADGLVSVTDPLLSIFPDDAPDEVSDNLAAMQVRHLLTMTTGHAEDTTGHLFRAEDGNWVKAFLALPVEYEPGTHFLYNTGASFVLSAIVQKLTGKTLLEYLTARVFEPLGIDGAEWDANPEGINMGGFGLNVKTEDIARLGQMYLQKGAWNGQQILPEAWVAEATSRQVDNAPNNNSDWEQGYGYQFWRCRHDAYRGDGAFGQYCIVMPDKDAVLAITSGVSDMQAVLNLVWDLLLPAMEEGALSEDAAAQKALEVKLSSLVLPLAQGASTSPVAATVSGNAYLFDTADQKAVIDRHNPDAEAQLIHAVSVELDGDGGTITVRDGRGDNSIAFDFGSWRYGETMLTRNEPNRVAASGAWTADDTLAVKFFFYETPFSLTLSCRFADGGVHFKMTPNVGFDPSKVTELVGKLQ